MLLKIISLLFLEKTTLSLNRCILLCNTMTLNHPKTSAENRQQKNWSIKIVLNVHFVLLAEERNKRATNVDDLSKVQFEESTTIG